MKACILDFKTNKRKNRHTENKDPLLQHDTYQDTCRNGKKDEITKESFYRMLEQAYNRAPSNDVKIVLGDFNAKIGREPEYKRVAGRQSLHAECNDNGMRMINFAIARDMMVSTTCFPRRDIHKWTWSSPDGKTHNQIDHSINEQKNA